MAGSQIKVAASVLLVLCWVYGGLGEVVVLQATRQVDLRTSVVTLGESLKLKNSGSAAVNHVIICAPEEWAERRAYLEVKEGGGGRDLQLAGSAPAQEGFTCERVELLQELGPGADATVDVLSRFTKVLSPLPATIPQNGQQLLLFEHTKLLASPYAVKSQSCSLLMPNPNNVKDYTKDSTTGRREAVISYGPYADTPAFHSSPLRVHFESDDPCFQITSLQREIQVSHWGRIFVEEAYRVRHGGAKHSGAWSRLDFLRPGASTSAALNVMPMVLPLSTQWPYYKDEIGNVSTSRVRREPRRVVAELMPRFPLFGGWQINFVWGYSLPLKGFLFSPAPGMRQLQADLSTSLQLEYAIDNLTVKVVLPEGSSDIRASIASRKPYTERREVKYTYLDTVGRPVVVLELANLVRQDNVQLLVDYNFQPVWMLHEPGLLVGAFLVLFLALIGALRLELTISRDQRWQQVQDRERCRDMLQKAVGLFAARRKVVLDWDNQYHVLGYAAQGPRPIPRSDDKAPGLLREGGRQLEQAAAEIRSLIKDIKAVSATQAAQVQELLDKDVAFVERVTKQMQQLTSSKPPPPAQLMAEEEVLSEMFKEVQKLRDSLVSVAY